MSTQGIKSIYIQICKSNVNRSKCDVGVLYYLVRPVYCQEPDLGKVVFLWLTINMQIKVVHNIALRQLGGAQDDFACLLSNILMVYSAVLSVSVLIVWH